MNKRTSLPMYYSRIFFLRSEIDRLLTVFMLFSCMLSLARIVYTGRLTFVTLVWNLFLAYVPYFITQTLSRKPQWIERKIVFLTIFVVWLLFVPNSFYIITDLFHLSDHPYNRAAPQWFDLALIFSFAWNGLLLGVLSVRQMEKIVQAYLYNKHELLFLYPIMWLNALGVYIGRYLRFNSWDVVVNPFELGYDIISMLVHPFRYSHAWSMIFCYSVLMTLMYLALKKLSRING